MPGNLTDDEVRQWLFALGALMMEPGGVGRLRGETEDGDRRLNTAINGLFMATWGLKPPIVAEVKFTVIHGGKTD
jgi:hypothetical protein